MTEIAPEVRPERLSDTLVKPYLKELFGYPHFLAASKATLPPALFDLIMIEKDQANSIFDFQSKIIHPILKHIEQQSITVLTSNGLADLSPQKQYLFISNHRDIVLDSAYLNNTLFEHGFQTSQIAIGDNLMRHRISELIFRLNKSFIVRRSGSPIELYRYSVLLAQHIRAQIAEHIDSVWIAQREGRAKDGNDLTQVGLVKMLSLDHAGDLKAHFKALHIVPVAISYEYDPCDVLKAQEFLNKRADPAYKKGFEEDVQHMLLGLTGAKGRVHFEFGKPLDDALDALDDVPNPKKQLEVLAGIIDHSIHKSYKLHPINSVAHYLLYGDTNIVQHLAPAEIDTCINYLENKASQLKNDLDGAGRRYFLGMYANPLLNWLRADIGS